MPIYPKPEPFKINAIPSIIISLNFTNEELHIIDNMISIVPMCTVVDHLTAIGYWGKPKISHAGFGGGPKIFTWILEVSLKFSYGFWKCTNSPIGASALISIYVVLHSAHKCVSMQCTGENCLHNHMHYQSHTLRTLTTIIIMPSIILLSVSSHPKSSSKVGSLVSPCTDAYYQVHTCIGENCPHDHLYY